MYPSLKKTITNKQNKIWKFIKKHYDKYMMQKKQMVLQERENKISCEIRNFTFEKNVSKPWLKSTKTFMVADSHQNMNWIHLNVCGFVPLTLHLQLKYSLVKSVTLKQKLNYLFEIIALWSKGAHQIFSQKKGNI